MTTLYTFDMFGVFEAEEPIIHTEESIGNIAKIKRMKVMYEGKPVLVPAVSGNSFRGQMRDLIADSFVEAIRDNSDKIMMKPDVYSLIFSGGVMKQGSDLSGRLEELLEAVPLLRVWGSAFGDVMMPSKISVSHFLPLTVETQPFLNSRLDKLAGENALIHRLQGSLSHLPVAEEITYEEGPLTRKNDLDNPIWLESVELTEETDKKSTQMIYHVECIASGTLLLHRLSSKFPLTQVELGCLLDGLSAFAKVPVIGGRSAAGYGRVNFTYCLSLRPSNRKEEPNLLDTTAFYNLAPKDNGTSLEQALSAYRSDIMTRAKKIRDILAK